MKVLSFLKPKSLWDYALLIFSSGGFILGAVNLYDVIMGTNTHIMMAVIGIVCCLVGYPIYKLGDLISDEDNDKQFKRLL